MSHVQTSVPWTPKSYTHKQDVKPTSVHHAQGAFLVFKTVLKVLSYHVCIHTCGLKPTSCTTITFKADQNASRALKLWNLEDSTKNASRDVLGGHYHCSMMMHMKHCALLACDLECDSTLFATSDWMCIRSPGAMSIVKADTIVFWLIVIILVCSCSHCEQRCKHSCLVACSLRFERYCRCVKSFVLWKWPGLITKIHMACITMPINTSFLDSVLQTSPTITLTQSHRTHFYNPNCGSTPIRYDHLPCTPCLSLAAPQPSVLTTTSL